MHICINIHIDGLMQDCSNSSALAMELLQYCTKPSTSTQAYICICTLYMSGCLCTFPISQAIGVIPIRQSIGSQKLVAMKWRCHYSDVIMDAMVSQITSIIIVYSTAYLDTDQRKHQNSKSLAFVRGIPRRPANSPHKGPITRKMFPFSDVQLQWIKWRQHNQCHLLFLFAEHFNIM